MSTSSPFQKLCEEFNLHPFVAQILLKRHSLNYNSLYYFLYGDFYSCASPFALSSLREASEFIKEGIDKKKAFYIVGDKDVDGVTSISILKIFFEKLGLKVYYNLPLGKESYGFSERIYEDIVSKKNEIHCVITVDCGIKENHFIEKLNQENIATIVTDHHTPEEELPNAYVNINPHLNEDHFFPICGANIALKLVQALYLSFSKLSGVKIICLSKHVESQKVGVGFSPDIFSPLEHTDELESLDEILEYMDEEPFMIIAPKSLEKNLAKLEFDVPPQKILIIDNLFASLKENKQPKTLKEICQQENIYYSEKNELLASFLLVRKYFCKYQLNLEEKLALFIEYASIATLCDRSKLNHIENRSLLKTGLTLLKKSQSSLSLLINEDTSITQLLDVEIPLRIGPLLNAAGRMGKANISVDFLTSVSQSEKEKNLLLLKNLNAERQKQQQRGLDEINTHLEVFIEHKEKPYFFYHSENITKGITSILANKLAKTLLKPVFIIALDKETNIGVGSARCIDNMGVHPILTKIQENFIAFGGHHKACGFSIEASKIDTFKNYLEGLSDKDFIDEQSIQESENSVLEIPLKFIDKQFCDSLFLLEPFGESNPLPIFKSKITLMDVKIFGKINNHLKIKGKENPNLEIIAWKKANIAKDIEKLEDLECTFKLTANYYGKQLSLSAILLD